MFVLSENGLRCADTKTGRSFGVSKTQKTGELVLFIDYQDHGETKYMPHKKFQTEREAADYMAQFCTKLNKVHYGDEKVLKVLFYKKE